MSNEAESGRKTAIRRHLQGVYDSRRDNLKMHMDIHGITGVKMAQMTGKGRTTVSDWMTGAVNISEKQARTIEGMAGLRFGLLDD